MKHQVKIVDGVEQTSLNPIFFPDDWVLCYGEEVQRF